LKLLNKNENMPICKIVPTSLGNQEPVGAWSLKQHRRSTVCIRREKCRGFQINRLNSDLMVCWQWRVQHLRCYNCFVLDFIGASGYRWLLIYNGLIIFIQSSMA
jgi:hypothetical protein